MRAGREVIRRVATPLCVLCALCGWLCGCATPATDKTSTYAKTVAPFPANVGNTVLHLIGDGAALISGNVASIAVCQATAATLAGPFTIDPLLVTFRAPLMAQTGAAK
jgi:hypothetical protein